MIQGLKFIEPKPCEQCHTVLASFSTLLANLWMLPTLPKLSKMLSVLFVGFCMHHACAGCAGFNNNEEPKHSMKKASRFALPHVSVQCTGNSVDRATDEIVSVTQQSDDTTTMKLLEEAATVDELLDHPASDLQPMESHGKNENIQEAAMDVDSNDDQTNNKNQKVSQRRASLPAKIDVRENGLHSTPKVPGYMSPTESAKAKLRGQGSPRFAQDGIDKSGPTGRHSLTSSTSGRLSSLSPRVTRLVQTAGKGVVKADRSLTSSRDGGDKVIQAEWRR